MVFIYNNITTLFRCFPTVLKIEDGYTYGKVHDDKFIFNIENKPCYDNNHNNNSP
jgi:hypothetical protein